MIRLTGYGFRAAGFEVRGAGYALRGASYVLRVRLVANSRSDASTGEQLETRNPYLVTRTAKLANIPPQPETRIAERATRNPFLL